MALTPEWNHRIQIWIAELKQHFFQPLGSLSLEMTVANDHLTVEQASLRPVVPVPPGTPWGMAWEYGWFRTEVVLPPCASGRRVVLKLATGGESLVFVDGRAVGGLGKEHHEVTLTRSGEPGRRYEIWCETYGGHGLRVESVGPVPPGRVPVPAVTAPQCRTGESVFGVWDDEAYQLWIEAELLYQVRGALPVSSLRGAQIDRALMDLTLTVDFEQDAPGRNRDFLAGRKLLGPLLDARNGTTAPLMYLVGQSHLDLSWLWPIEETRRKIARTMSTQLALMDEYPEFQFLLCQVPLFETLRDGYPDLYRQVKEAATRGQIVVDGAVWIEPDTNIPSGESLVRQFLYGKQFYQKEFGVDSRLLWLPDCFGFSPALPQIMKGFGVDFFGTKKLSDVYGGGQPFPHTVFEWEGLDGTRVLAHLFRKSNQTLDAKTLMRRWDEDRPQKNGIVGYLYPFGYGDGGGGPTRDHLENARRLADLEGVPRTKMAPPLAFYEAVAEAPVEARYVGELYFAEHRGTYTSQAKTKKANRRAEFALRDLEFWASAAAWLENHPYPYAPLERLWKTLLFQQFHDVIAGVSIARVHAVAEDQLAEVIAEAGRLAEAAREALQGPPTPVTMTVSNSLSWDRTALVALPEGWTGVSESATPTLPLVVQSLGSKLWAEVRVPACGWTTLAAFSPSADSPWAPESSFPQTAEIAPPVLENEHLKLTFNRFGAITSVWDKDTADEWASGPVNEFRLFKDVTNVYDAWDIDSMYDRLPVPLDEPAQFRWTARGPLVWSIEIDRQLAHSHLHQRVSLTRGCRRVDFHTTVEWNENHRLLKVAFPVNIHADQGVHEVQFGHLGRPNHRSTRYEADRFEVAQQKWTAVLESGRGAAVINDSKYGVGVEGGTISLTLLKAAMVPDPTADRGTQTFAYALSLWNGSFSEGGVVRQAYEFNVPVVLGQGQGNRSLVKIDHQAIVLEAAKRAEDGSGDLILRLYESTRCRVKCRLTSSLPVGQAFQTNLLEESPVRLEWEEAGVELTFRPFEIKTLRLVRL